MVSEFTLTDKHQSKMRGKIVTLLSCQGELSFTISNETNDNIDDWYNNRRITYNPFISTGWISLIHVLRITFLHPVFRCCIRLRITKVFLNNSPDSEKIWAHQYFEHVFVFKCVLVCIIYKCLCNNARSHSVFKLPRTSNTY